MWEHLTGDPLWNQALFWVATALKGCGCSKDAKKELQENLKEQRTSEKRGKKQSVGE